MWCVLPGSLWSSVTVVTRNFVFVDAVVAVTRSQGVSVSYVLFGSIQGLRQSMRARQNRRSCLSIFAPVDTKCCSSTPCRECRNESLPAVSRIYCPSRDSEPIQNTRFLTECLSTDISSGDRSKRDCRRCQRLEQRLSTAELAR